MKLLKIKRIIKNYKLFRKPFSQKGVGRWFLLEDKITADWNINDILEELGEEGIKVLDKYDICVTCLVFRGIKLGTLAVVREIELGSLIEELNEAIKNKKDN